MSSRKLSPRPEIVQFLAKEVLSTLDGTGEDNITSSEILSTAFTVTAHIIREMLAVDSSPDRERNIESITDAIGQLYALLPPRSMH